MLRITNEAGAENAVNLVLEGRLAGAWVDELAQVVNRSLRTGARVSLDLARVDFADRRGVELFRTLRSRDLAMLHCPGFIAEMMGDNS